MYRGTKVALSVLALVIAMVAVLPVRASATADPLTITATTTLTANHLGSIIIGANGITFDCAGFSVIGSGSGIGVDLSGRTGVTVKNCEVTGFVEGFRLSSSSGNTLTGNTAVGNGFAGFSLDTSSNGNALEDNEATGNAFGFFLLFSSGNTLEDNEAEDNGGSGFNLLDSDGNLFKENEACGNGSFDAFQDAFSTGNVFVDNDFCTTSGIP